MEYIKQDICNILRLVFSCPFAARVKKRLPEKTEWMELLGKEQHEHNIL